MILYSAWQLGQLKMMVSELLMLQEN
jgi:hypothetical protein